MPKQNNQNTHLSIDKNQGRFPHEDGGILNSESFINIKRTGVKNPQ